MTGTPEARHDVVVVGAGLAGLTCAHRMQQAGRSVTVLESSDRVGGRVRTCRMGSAMVDVGAGFLTTFHRRTLALVREAGLQDDLVALTPGAVLVEAGRQVPLGLSALLPVGGLLSPRALAGLLRLVATGVRHWSELDPGDAVRAHRLDDRSVEDCTPQLGRELVDRLFDPALRAFLYSRADSTSRALAVLLARAALDLRQFLTLRHGLGSLTDALAADLPVHLRTAVRAASRSDGGWRLVVRRDGADATVMCDRLVLAVPGDVAGTLLDTVPVSVRGALQSVTYRSAWTAAVSDVRSDARPYGAVIVSPAASRRLAMASVLSVLNPLLVAPGCEVVVLYGVESPSADDGPGEDPLVTEARRVLPGYVPDVAHDIVSTAWPRAVPDFEVGRMRLLSQLDHGALARLGLALAGDYLNGPLMEGAVRSGESAAERLLRRAA